MVCGEALVPPPAGGRGGSKTVGQNRKPPPPPIEIETANFGHMVCGFHVLTRSKGVGTGACPCPLAITYFLGYSYINIPFCVWLALSWHILWCQPARR